VRSVCWPRRLHDPARPVPLGRTVPAGVAGRPFQHGRIFRLGPVPGRPGCSFVLVLFGFLRLSELSGYFLLGCRCRRDEDHNTVCQVLEKRFSRKVDHQKLFGIDSPYLPFSQTQLSHTSLFRIIRFPCRKQKKFQFRIQSRRANSQFPPFVHFDESGAEI